MVKSLFPLGIATGPAFCDREAERAYLSKNVRDTRHTWLQGPRRYGKTSLVRQVTLELEELTENEKTEKFAAISLDLLVTHDIESLQAVLLDGVGKLTGQIIPFHQNMANKLGDFFKSLRTEVTLANNGPQVKFITGKGQPDHIMNALLGLDKVASKHGYRVLLVLDEFQQLASIPGSNEVEAAIRHAVERAQSVTYLFSGSQRHLLGQMFEDSSRPLYHLCERLVLERISVDDYREFLNKAAEKQWGSQLSNDVIEVILTLTSRHPYYINSLCGRLWQEDKLPRKLSIEKEWFAYVEEEHHRVKSELIGLSPNQRAVLNAIAQEPTKHPTSKEFVSRVRVAGASVSQSVAVLKEKDLLYVDQAGFTRVLDPVIEWYLKKIFE